MKNTQKAAQKSCREVYKVLVKQLNRESIKKDCGVFRNAGPQCFVMCCRRAERLCREEPTPTQKLQIKATTLTPDLDCIHSWEKKKKTLILQKATIKNEKRLRQCLRKAARRKVSTRQGKGCTLLHAGSQEVQAQDSDRRTRWKSFLQKIWKPQTFKFKQEGSR